VHPVGKFAHKHVDRGRRNEHLPFTESFRLLILTTVAVSQNDVLKDKQASGGNLE
jgi:hypothetical protein